MRQATEAATEAAALRWTSAEASPYCPQARPRTGPKAARAPETAVVLPPLWAWTTAGDASRARALRRYSARTLLARARTAFPRVMRPGGPRLELEECGDGEGGGIGWRAKRGVGRVPSKGATLARTRTRSHVWALDQVGPRPSLGVGECLVGRHASGVAVERYVRGVWRRSGVGSGASGSRASVS
eukprot:scaffold375_cov97-Isochrysis_galbana.AAC.1